MRKVNLIVFIIFLSNSLFGQGILSVQKVGEKPLKNADNLIIYALPRTTLAFKIVSRVTNTYYGPYFAYAEEYLGIKGAPSENKTEWSIDSVNILSFKEADPDEYYAVKTKSNFNPKPIFLLNESGLILDPSLPEQLGQQNDHNIITKKNALTSEVIEVSMQKYYNEKADTFYKTMLKDSIYLKIPLIRTRQELKNLKDKAREAADVIVKIRQRRFEMILSEDEALPEVKAFHLALDEMRKIEEDYLALFTGRQTTNTFTTWFYYTPASVSRDSQFEIFRFSSKNGISDRKDATATPVFLTFEKDNRTRAINDWMQYISNPGQNHLFYRIPDAATVDVIWKGDLLASKKLLIYQFGTVVPFPVNVGK
jgi:Domain of unknown function (DUF4831)